MKYTLECDKFCARLCPDTCIIFGNTCVFHIPLSIYQVKVHLYLVFQFSLIKQNFVCMIFSISTEEKITQTSFRKSNRQSDTRKVLRKREERKKK